MPIRIYALAKELNIDSKELVDVCKKAGIPGKGSALASLDDDEAVKVREYLTSSTASPAAPAARPQIDAPERPSPAAKANKPRVFKTKKKTTASAEQKPGPLARATEEVEEVEVEVEAEVEEPVVEETPVVAEAPVSEPETEAPEEEATSDQGAEVAPMSREDAAPIPRRGIKVFGRGRKADGGDAAEKPKPKKRAPVINVRLAPAPEVKQPKAKATKSNEPKPQKPEIRLPQEAIDGHRQGNRPLLEHLESAEKRKGGPGQPAAEQPAAAAGKRGRKGKGGQEGGGGGLADMATARANRKKNRSRSSRSGDDDEPRRRGRRTLTRTKNNDTAAPRKSKAVLELPCTVRSFSEAASVPSNRVQAVLIKQGVMATINAQIDEELAAMLAEELGVELEFKQPESLEESLIDAIESHEDDEDSLVGRPPVVTFLGHVDHGKTSLLDAIIGINVVDKEAGGITQHIRAYEINKDGRHISFVDTPGHEAFTEMRARGANVTDIAVLVIAADDGVMPQTEEAISHAKAAEVPIVVALNKCDLPGADPSKVMTQLTQYELTPSEWGGDTEVVQTSAITGDGMDSLLETILTLAELHEYQANPKRDAVGTCLEAEQEPGRGVIAKVIVQSGTLNVGDIVVCGAAHGRVKAMFDTLKTTKRVKTAGPSTPVNITGLDSAPEAGDRFHVLQDISAAREIAAQRGDRGRVQSLAGITTKITFEEFNQRMAEGRLGADEVASLNLIVRADVRGSIEAIQKELGKLTHPEVQINIRQASVGGITAADVTLAHATNAVIIGFNVIPDDAARLLADEREVEIRRYSIIYKVSDDIKALLEGKLKPEERLIDLGHALVKQVFPISRIGAIAGCYVARGVIERGCRIRVNRDGRTIGDYPLDSLRREKDDVKEVPRGMECGIKLSGFNDIKQDDILEAYKIEEVARTL